MADDLSQTIADAAAGPSQASSDGLAVTQQPLPDLVEADKHLAAKSGARRKDLGVRLRKLVPPGAA